MSVGTLDPRPQLPRAIAALFIAVIALASLAALALPELRKDRTPTGPTRVGVITRVVTDPATGGRAGMAAPEFQWVRPNGETTRLSALRGKPVVLNFWATWCVPCRAEMPRIEAAAEANGGTAFLEVDLDEDGDKVRSFLDSLGVTAPEPVIDVGTQLARAYGLSAGVPTTYFVDGTGVVRSVVIGEMDDARLRAGLASVRP